MCAHNHTLSTHAHTHARTHASPWCGEHNGIIELDMRSPRGAPPCLVMRGGALRDCVLSVQSACVCPRWVTEEDAQAVAAAAAAANATDADADAGADLHADDDAAGPSSPWLW